MAFVVEDGTGLPNSTSYASVAFSDSHHSDRGQYAWTGAVSEKEAALIRATSFIERRFRTRFRGIRQSRSQALSWPRNGAIDSDGYEYEDIPLILQQATAEYAMRALQYGELSPDVPPPIPRQDNSSSDLSTTSTTPGEIKRQRVEVVGSVVRDTEYVVSDSTSRSTQSTLVDSMNLPEYPAADLLIEQLIRYSQGSATSVRA